MITKEDIKFYEDDDGYITSVFLPLSPEEWCECCMREGAHYVGDCCGNMSYAQDILNRFFRDGGWVSPRDLARYIEMMRSHDGYDKEDLPDPQAQESTDPLARIIAVWDLISSNIKPLSERSINKPRKADLSNPRHAIRELTNGAWSLSWILLESGDSFHKRQDTIANLMRVIPAFNSLVRYMDELIPDPIEGVGLFLDGEVVETRSGYAIYESEEKAKDVLKYWDDGEQFSLKRVRLSVADGVEILE